MEDYMGDPEGYGMLKNYLEKLGEERISGENRIFISHFAHGKEPLPAVHFGYKLPCFTIIMVFLLLPIV
jgi:hypothetical protein